MHGWRSWLTSTGLGLLGALVGFWIFHGLFGIGDTDKFDWGGIVGAVIGAHDRRCCGVVRSHAGGPAQFDGDADPEVSAYVVQRL